MKTEIETLQDIKKFLQDLYNAEENKEASTEISNTIESIEKITRFKMTEEDARTKVQIDILAKEVDETEGYNLEAEDVPEIPSQFQKEDLD